MRFINDLWNAIIEIAGTTAIVAVALGWFLWYTNHLSIACNNVGCFALMR